MMSMDGVAVGWTSFRRMGDFAFHSFNVQYVKCIDFCFGCNQILIQHSKVHLLLSTLGFCNKLGITEPAALQNLYNANCH